MKPWPAGSRSVPGLRLNLHLLSWAALAGSKPKKRDSHRLGLFKVIFGLLKTLVDQLCLGVFWKWKNIKMEVEPGHKSVEPPSPPDIFFFSCPCSQNWHMHFKSLKHFGFDISIYLVFI